MTVSHAVSHGRTRGCVTRGVTLLPAAAAAGVDSSAALLQAEPWLGVSCPFGLSEKKNARNGIIKGKMSSFFRAAKA